MQNTFEQLNKSLDSLNLILKEEIALTQIEKDIVLEKLRKLYLQLYAVSATESSENNDSDESKSDTTETEKSESDESKSSDEKQKK